MAVMEKPRPEAQPSWVGGGELASPGVDPGRYLWQKLMRALSPGPESVAPTAISFGGGPMWRDALMRGILQDQARSGEIPAVGTATTRAIISKLMPQATDEATAAAQAVRGMSAKPDISDLMQAAGKPGSSAETYSQALRMRAAEKAASKRWSQYPYPETVTPGMTQEERAAFPAYTGMEHAPPGVGPGGTGALSYEGSITPPHPDLFPPQYGPAGGRSLDVLGEPLMDMVGRVGESPARLPEDLISGTASELANRFGAGGRVIPLNPPPLEPFEAAARRIANKQAQVIPFSTLRPKSK